MACKCHVHFNACIEGILGSGEPRNIIKQVMILIPYFSPHIHKHASGAAHTIYGFGEVIKFL